MYDQGLIKQKEDGQFVIVEDKEERDFISESNKKNRMSSEERAREEESER